MKFKLFGKNFLICFFMLVFVTSCAEKGSGSNSSNVFESTASKPNVDLRSDRSSVPLMGKVTLSWDAIEVDSCMASGDWSGAKNIQGSEEIINLSSDSHFELDCTGSEGSAKDAIDVTIDMPSAPTLDISANPSTVAINGSALISWEGTDIDDCDASGDWSGTRNSSGSQLIQNLNSDSIYILTCSGPGGSISESATVTVALPGAPVVNLSASPASIGFGGTTTLSWNGSNIDSCNASGNWSGPKGNNGSQTFSGLTSNTVFTLSCSGAGGNTSDTVTVAVAPPGKPTVNLSASPTSVPLDGSTTLSWNTDNADNCTASGDWTGSRNTDGSQTVSGIEENSTFVLSCNGPGGNGSDSVTVSITDPDADPLELPLVQASDGVFVFRGTYNIPSTLVNDDGRAGGGYAVSQDGQFMYLNSFEGTIAKYRIPAINGTASLEYGWRGTPDSVSSDNKVHGAQVEYNGSLFNTKYAEYSTNGESKWIQRGNTAGTGFTSLFRISGIGNARRMAQGFMHVPPEWQDVLGGPVAALGARLSIVANAQNGYGFAVFDPDDIGGSNRVTPLLDYPFGSPLEPGGPSYPGWSGYPKNSSGGTDLFSQTNAPLAGALIVPGSRSLLFVTTHGYGSPGGSDPCRSGSSVGNDPYRMQVVAYDLRDLVRVKVGDISPSSVRPYAWWEWNAGGVHWNSCVGEVPLYPGFGTYDPVQGRWYMDAQIRDGRVYVWDVVNPF